MKKGLLFIFLILIYYSVFVSVTNVNAYENSNEKIYCNVSINENFVDNEIIILLNNEESLKMKDYNESFLNNIDYIDIEDLTYGYNSDIINDKNNLSESDFIKKYSNFQRILKIKLKEHSKENVLEKIKIIEQRNEIVCANPNMITYETFEGTTSNSTNDSGNWWYDNINAGDALEYIYDNNLFGNNYINVAVIDSGVDSSHKCLEGKINTTLSKTFLNGETEEAINNLYSPLNDNYGHGTFIAGLIAGKSIEDSELRGISITCRIVSLRVMRENEKTTSDCVSAINYADMNDIPIINFSMNIDSSEKYIIESSIRNYSGLFVCSAGNDHQDNDDFDHYPSNFSFEHILAVGAITKDNELPYYPSFEHFVQGSNYGKNSVDLLAPGDNIKVLAADLTHNMTSHKLDTTTELTSPAAAIVSGVASMIKGVYPYMTPFVVKDIIMNNVNVHPLHSEHCVSSGTIDAFDSIKNYEEISFNENAVQSNNLKSKIKNNKTKVGFLNDSTNKLIKIELNVTLSSGLYDYPEGCIKVKDNYNNVVSYGINNSGENVIYLNLPSDDYYYIDICVENSRISDVKINLEKFENVNNNTINLDLFESASNVYSKNIFSNVTTSNYFKKISIKQTLSYYLKFNLASSIEQSISVIIFKKITEESDIFIPYSISQISTNDDSYRYEFLEGTYYIGYDGLLYGSVSLIFENYKDTNSTFNIITDPDANNLCGSQINVFEKKQEAIESYTYRGTGITVGFTRILYFSNEAPSLSRLDYYWYSSDGDTVQISEYGTALAIDSQSYTVTILAVYKYDASKYTSIQLSIMPAAITPPIQIYLNDVYVNPGTTNVINMDGVNVPSPLLQHYSWDSNISGINVNNWGIFVVSSNLPNGTYLITGTYNYNSNVTIKINVIVNN